MRLRGKMWWSQRHHKLRHNMAHMRCMLNKQGYMHASPCTRPRARAHACTCAHTTMQYLLLYHGNNDLKRASVLRYTYIVLLSVDLIYFYN
jgi:hypothetical protein